MPVDSYSTFFLLCPSSLRLALCLSTSSSSSSSSSSSPVFPRLPLRFATFCHRLVSPVRAAGPIHVPEGQRQPNPIVLTIQKTVRPRGSATATICCFREGMPRVVEVTRPLVLERRFTSIFGKCTKMENACFYRNVINIINEIFAYQFQIPR